MRIFKKGNFHEEAKLFIKEWIQLLSKDKFQEALNLLDQLPKEDGEFYWSKGKLEEVFKEYGNSERMPKIDDPFAMGKEGESFDFYKYDDGSGWAIEYDIPLDGKKSDLTADFTFIKSSGDLYSINLHDLHVM
ncbi:DUF7668 domain-containing protein [Rufibacter immobilis]|uniref:DUF7668 domain-containing protein n=1 Tax=Rufibacter immobilis TaxID=1348778 RepID=UPI0035E58B5B